MLQASSFGFSGSLLAADTLRLQELNSFTISENEYLSTIEPTEQPPSSRRGTWRPREEAVRHRTSHVPSIPHSDDVQHEQWPCPFCLTPHRRKDWKRHMDSKHVPKSWFCMPTNSPLDDDNTCVFCGSKDGGSKSECKHYKIDVCCGKDLNHRVYATKDKLRQHMRTVHLRARSKTTEQAAIHIPQSWHIPQHVDSTLWCGICRVQLSDWEMTKEHIAKHFRRGERLSEWQPWEAPVAGTP
jgi:hypothetical protein